jgi:hypothetical protein
MLTDAACQAGKDRMREQLAGVRSRLLELIERNETVRAILHHHHHCR